jgi:hypothetical protein
MVPDEEKLPEDISAKTMPQDVYFYALFTAEHPMFLKGHAKGHVPQINLSVKSAMKKPYSVPKGHRVHFKKPRSHEEVLGTAKRKVRVESSSHHAAEPHKGKHPVEDDEGFEEGLENAVHV